ncbi:translation initiation factor IF-2-like [Triticum urartu]|uniref:translation initiation factor IF-2-like n=1 Tax=Triticum urartu TaxID=4572 RepID=UPI002042FD6A|nr:translation initiation factor IF-2-like [Triticum urartu]
MRSVNSFLPLLLFFPPTRAKRRGSGADAGARQVDSGHLWWSSDHRSDREDKELLPGPSPSSRERDLYRAGPWSRRKVSSAGVGTRRLGHRTTAERYWEGSWAMWEGSGDGGAQEKKTPSHPESVSAHSRACWIGFPATLTGRHRPHWSSPPSVSPTWPEDRPSRQSIPAPPRGRRPTSCASPPVAARHPKDQCRPRGPRRSLLRIQAAHRPAPVSPIYFPPDPIFAAVQRAFFKELRPHVSEELAPTPLMPERRSQARSGTRTTTPPKPKLQALLPAIFEPLVPAQLADAARPGCGLESNQRNRYV